MHQTTPNPDRSFPYHESGLAFGAILLVAILLVAIGIAIALGLRSLAGSSSTDNDRTLASTIINQASYLQRADDDYRRQGIETCELWFHDTWVANKSYNVYDSTFSTVPEQVPPAAALNDPTQTWTYKWTQCWGTVYVAGIGSATGGYESGYYAFIQPDLKQGVCAQINNLLYSSSVIAVSTNTFTDWTASSGALVTVNAGTSKEIEACVQTTDGKYIFYIIVDLHQPGQPAT